MEQTIQNFYKGSLVNEDIFTYNCEALVVPVSWAGTISSSFTSGLQELLKNTSTTISLGSYELGEIEVYPIQGHTYLRYVILACTVGQVRGSYGALRKIGTELAKFARKNGIRRIATPLLGTGAGELDPKTSFQMLATSFWHADPVDCKLAVCVPDDDIWIKVKKAIPEMEGFPEARTLLEFELTEVLELPHIRKILYGEAFYYQLAYDKFKEFQSYTASSEFYRKLSARFTTGKQLYSQFLSEFETDSDEYMFLKLCGELVAYIDYRAYLKSVWNEYSDKRVIAHANVRQRNWIQNLLTYKEAGNNLHSIRANSIRNALLYFYDPERTLTMLSENHRKMVVWTFLGVEYNAERANYDISSLFKSKKIVCENPQNNGALYSLILYSSAIKPLWLEDATRTEEVGKVTWGLNSGEEASGIEYAARLIHDNLMSGDTELDLGNCNLKDLTPLPELAECVHLKKLILSNEWSEYNEEDQKWEKRTSRNKIGKNRLRYLPSYLEALTNLEILICGGDWSGSNTWELFERWEIRDLSVLAKLVQLRHLNLSNNIIHSIKSLSNLSSLQVLHLNNNLIESVAPLKELSRLEELYLSNNSIKEVDSLKEMESLRTLDLHANNIKDLSRLQPLIERIGIVNAKWRKNTINVARNLLEKPPIQIVENGTAAVIQYFKDLRPKNYINKEIKVVLVGNSEVGKTTLAKYLNNEKELEKPHSATHWMKELEVTSKYSVEGVCKDCTLHLFDFGGHDYFHDTHHIFYSPNTLYILLWEEKSNRLFLRDTRQTDYTGTEVAVQTQDYPIEYWLESIEFYAKEKEADNFAFEPSGKSSYNSYTLVVQNKVEKREDIVPLNNKELLRKYPFIYDFMHMSIIRKRRNMAYFDTLFEEMLNKMPIIGAVLPPYYGVVKEHITTAYTEAPIISMEEFHAYCNRLLFPETITSAQSRDLADYLRQIGVILLNDRNREKVYIRKNWIIDNIYNVLKGVKEQKGQFDLPHVKNQIETDWEEDARDILSIMEDFKMIFQHPYESDCYIAPLYLPQMPDEVVGLFLEKDPIPYRRLEYSGFIHKQIILNFFHQYGRLIWGEKGESGSYYYYWKDGLILKDPDSGNMVMIVFKIGDKNEGNACIDIFEVRDKSKEKDFINSIISYLKVMNTEYKIKEMVTLDGEEFVSLELLKQHARDGNLRFTNSHAEENEDVQTERKYYQLKDYKQFIMDEEIKKKKVVISYSKKDLRQLNLLKRYLRPLVDMELITEPWNCTHNLDASQEWDGEIKERFEEADIVIFLVSENFYDTPYIVEHEIKKTIDRYDQKKSVKIVPIILEFYDWQRKEPYNLQRFTALPYQAKPISDFDNPKLAWYTTYKAIRTMIEKDIDPVNKGAMSREIQDIYERQVSGMLDRNSL